MKRYTTREQIVKDIDRALAKVQKSLEQAREHLDAEELLTGGDNVTALREEREKADKLFRRIKRLQERRLPALKSKLAEFDTISLLPDDKSPETNLESSPPNQPLPSAEQCDVSP